MKRFSRLINRCATLSIWLKQSNWGNFLFLLFLFAIVRVSFALLIWSGLNHSVNTSDYSHFLAMAQMSDQGLYPYLGFWVEYPPIFPLLNTLLYRFSLDVTGGLSTWPRYFGLVISVRVIPEIVTFILIYMISLRLWGKNTASKSIILYSLLFLPYYLWNGAFDSIPTCLFMMSLLLLIDNHDISSAVVSGLGVLTKVFPGLIIPLAFSILPTIRRKLRYVFVAACIVILGMLPFLLINPTMTLASLGNISGARKSYESIWAIIDGYFSFGSVSPDRLDPAKAVPTAASIVPWPLVTVLFGFIFLVVYWRMWNKRGARQTVIGATITLNLLLLYSRGYSPQFLMWIAPLIAILFPNRRGIVYLLLFGIINLLEYPVYFVFIPDQTWLMVFIGISRTALLIALCVSCMGIILPGKDGLREPVKPIVVSKV